MSFRESAALPLALLGSIALHTIFIPVIYANKENMAHLPATKATHLDTPPVEDESVELGIDKSEEATLTWLGYEEYEEQRARFAEVEQAEMQAEVAIATPTPAQLAIDIAKNLAEPISQLSKELLEALQGIEISVPSRELEVQPDRIESTVALVHETQPNPAPETKEKVEQEGVASDRDSSATSTIKITPEQWKSGKPLAAKGIVLRPRRPSFTANQLVTNAPSDLVADLLINKKGKPTDVIIVYSTGSPSIDGSLIASLYRWRASGEQIDSLEDDETILISIHITFAK